MPEAVVRMFGQTKRCQVEVIGPPQTEYMKNQIYWVERPEDEYGIPQLKPPMCVLRRSDWLRGSEVSE